MVTTVDGRSVTVVSGRTYNVTIDPTAFMFERQAAIVYACDDQGFCPDGGWIEEATIDQWWHIWIACDHGRWRGVSNGPVDLGRGLSRAIEKAKQAHEARKDQP